MSNLLVLNIARFILLLFFQVLILNYMELSVYLFPMIYPLFILLLPVDMNRFTIILLALLLGFFIDIFSNTYGLHASAALTLAFVRRPVLKIMEKREGYEPNSEPGLSFGGIWFFSYCGILILSHHLWFFILEIFRWDMIGFIILKSVLSSVVSTALIIMILLLFRKTK